MFKEVKLFLILLVMSAAAQASGYPCESYLQDDILITPQQIILTGHKQQVTIALDGQVRNNGALVSLSKIEQTRAKNYQTRLRNDIPTIQRELNNLLQNIYQGYQETLIKSVGRQSKSQGRVTEMRNSISALISTFIGNTPAGDFYRYSALIDVEKRGSARLKKQFYGLLQTGVSDLMKKGITSISRNTKKLELAFKEQGKVAKIELKKGEKLICSKIEGLEKERQYLYQTMVMRSE